MTYPTLQRRLRRMERLRKKHEAGQELDEAEKEQLRQDMEHVMEELAYFVETVRPVIRQFQMDMIDALEPLTELAEEQVDD